MKGSSITGVTGPKTHVTLHWSIIEKTSEAKHGTQSVFKFSDVLFALKPVDPS